MPSKQTISQLLQKRGDRRAVATHAAAAMLGLKLDSSWGKWRKYVTARQQKHEDKALAIAARRERLLFISFQTLKVEGLVLL